VKEEEEEKPHLTLATEAAAAEADIFDEAHQSVAREIRETAAA
jgi:hypothetical protein